MSHGKRNPTVRILRATLLLGVAFALVAGANWAARRCNLRWDLTRLSSHTLSQRTLEVLAGLNQNVKVTAFHPGLAPEALTDLLDEFARRSGGRVATEVLDPVQNLGYAAQFGNKIDVSEKRVFIQAGKSREQLDCTETPLDENRLAAALYRTANDASKVYFLRGHDEYDWKSKSPEGLGKLAAALEELNLRVESLELATAGKIPADCRVLVIAGARTTPGEEEYREIRRYLQDGGHVLFLVESAFRTAGGTPTAQEGRMNPSWNEVLDEWGVHVGDDVVVDLSNHLGQDLGCPAVSTYPDHDKIVKGLGITFYIRPRSISFNRNEKRKVLYAPLVRSMGEETSWAETDRTLYTRYDQGEDLAGPVTIGAVLLQDPTTWKDGKAAKLVVIGDADFVQNQYTNKYSNLDLVLNSITWLAQREVLAGEERNAPPEARLEMTARDLKLAVGGLALAPLAAAGLGAGVWARRGRGRGRGRR
ncbi:MAG: GldG family protein [Candidatus Riflebacteria bacterium]|nr:GldG family protein [Candidatus Riflebacteria bacterium]